MRKRITVCSFVFVLLALASEARAQTQVSPTQFVAVDQSDYANVTRFEGRVDTAAWGDLGKPPAAGTLNTVTFPMPAMTPGPHAITVRACNTAGCSAASAPLNVIMVAVPQVPANPRIVSAP